MALDDQLNKNVAKAVSDFQSGLAGKKGQSDFAQFFADLEGEMRRNPKLFKKYREGINQTLFSNQDLKIKGLEKNHLILENTNGKQHFVMDVHGKMLHSGSHANDFHARDKHKHDQTERKADHKDPKHENKHTQADNTKPDDHSLPPNVVGRVTNRDSSVTTNYKNGYRVTEWPDHYKVVQFPNPDPSVVELNGNNQITYVSDGSNPPRQRRYYYDDQKQLLALQGIDGHIWRKVATDPRTGADLWQSDARQQWVGKVDGPDKFGHTYYSPLYGQPFVLTRQGAVVAQYAQPAQAGRLN